MAKSPQNKPGHPQPTPSISPSPQHQSVKSLLVGSGWSGPLPPPEALSQFNDIIPNGAERILRLAEQQQESRIELESSGQKAAIAEAKRGQWLGAGISLSAIVGAVVSVSLGAHWTVSAMLVGVPIMGVVKAIVDSRSQNKKE